MIGISMKHLRYFDALARLQHFGNAAEDCAVTQPALSMQIKELEALVGAPLVERGARKVRLTALGEEFADRAREILSKVADLGDLARVAKSPLVGRLRLGVIPTIAPYLLPRIIQRLAETHPSLELTPREAVTSRLIADLNEARMDAAILALPISEPGLMEVPLFDEDFVLVRAAEDAGKPVPSPERLREMQLLLLEEGHCFRDQALAFCKATSTNPRYMMEGSSLSTLVQMVGSGIGVTLIPEMAVPIETRSADVSVSQFKRPKPSRRIGIVWRKTNPLADQFVEIAESLTVLDATANFAKP